VSLRHLFVIVLVVLLVCGLTWLKAEDICSGKDPCADRLRACKTASFFRSFIGMDPVTVGACDEAP
jgi:hypothetical protein